MSVCLLLNYSCYRTCIFADVDTDIHTRTQYCKKMADSMLFLDSSRSAKRRGSIDNMKPDDLSIDVDADRIGIETYSLIEMQSSQTSIRKIRKTAASGQKLIPTRNWDRNTSAA